MDKNYIAQKNRNKVFHDNKFEHKGKKYTLKTPMKGQENSKPAFNYPPQKHPGNSIQTSKNKKINRMANSTTFNGKFKIKLIWRLNQR